MLHSRKKKKSFILWEMFDWSAWIVLGCLPLRKLEAYLLVYNSLFCLTLSCSCMTLAFKILLPPTLRALSQKELCLFREQHHWPDIRQFSRWSETVLHGHHHLQRRKPVVSFQESNLRPRATCLVFLPGSHVGLCSGPCEMAEQRFCVDYAKRGTAGCKKCKEKIVKGVCRIGKVVPNPFSESGGDMKEWYHIKCMFEKLERARATTKKIEDLTELEGWEELEDNEKEQISQHIAGGMENTAFSSYWC